MDALAVLGPSLAGRYNIEREIGRGGMATVFLARDVRHNRRVALKVLNPELGAVLGVERFLSEIQVTANLQHPNLLPLFDSGEAQGLLFYVMPYIEGESLRAKLEREKQLPIEETIHIATAVASALDYAHRHNVVHRDLKPENILLHEDQPMVADFGIALAVSNAGGSRITQTGLSLGTPQYMSPEQATGDRLVDGRTDVYSLGAVTYEMLTGEPPHSGPTTQSIIAKVITDRPRSIRLARDMVPEHVEAAVERALAKLPADRFHWAHEFADALLGKSVVIPSGFVTAGTIRRDASTGKRRKRVVALAPWIAAIALGIAGAVWGVRASRMAGTGATSFFIEPPVSNGIRERISTLAISPDGRTVGFVAQSDSSSQLYLRRLEDLESRPVPGTNGAFDVAFSPDGNWLAVAMMDGTLRKALADGSSMATIAEGLKYFGFVTWADNQTIVIGGEAGARGGLARLAASGGTVRPLTKPATSSSSHGMPFVASDGVTVLFEDWGPGFTEDDFLAIGSLETGEFSTTPLLAVQPIGVVDGRIVYVSGSGAIMAVPFNARSRRLTGEPVRVMEGVGADHRGVLGLSPHATAALSSSGTLVYTRGRPTQHLLLVDSAGGNGVALTSDNRDHLSSWSGGPRFSPDGRRIAVNVFTLRGDTTKADIWTLDVDSRTFTQLTTLGNVVAPEWTPDGKRLVFTTWYETKPTIWWQAADGSHAAEKLLELPDGQVVRTANVTPDGRGIVFCRVSDLAGNSDLFYLPFAGDRTPQRIAGPFSWGCEGRVSPNGRWLAYVANEGAKPNVFVRAFRGPAARFQISQDGGDAPRWSRDGSQLYYRRVESAIGRGSLFAAQIGSAADRVHVLKRRRLLALEEAGVYDIAPDGRHILMLQQSESRAQVVVTMNWITQLRARLRGSK